MRRSPIDNVADESIRDVEDVQVLFVAKTERINMRLPRQLLDAVKAKAADAHMPDQRFIRAVLEEAVTQRNRPAP